MRSLLLLAGLALSACASAPPPAPTVPVRVMSFNIRVDVASDGENAWPNRVDAVAAAVRMSPKAKSTPVTREVFAMLGGMSKHPVVKQMVELVSESHFDPNVIDKVQLNARKFVALSRKRYTEALRNNLKMLLKGDIDSRAFVAQFFELSEAGNLRVDIRKRLILGILTSETIRPSIKFLFLEQLGRLPLSVQREIITDALNAPDRPKLEAIKQELAWIRLKLKPAKVN